MSKRKSALGGGTGDMSPQWLSVSITQSAADADTNIQIPLPVPRYNAGKDRSIVIEVLKVVYVINNLSSAGAQQAYNCTLSTADVGLAAANSILGIGDPRTFSFFTLDFIFATAVGLTFQTRRFDDDLRDGSGRGVLVATDSIFLSCATNLTGQANVFAAKILYRFTDISLSEYIGIVQAQQ